GRGTTLAGGGRGTPLAGGGRGTTHAGGGRGGVISFSGFLGGMLNPRSSAGGDVGKGLPPVAAEFHLGIDLDGGVRGDLALALADGKHLGGGRAEDDPTPLVVGVFPVAQSVAPRPAEQAAGVDFVVRLAVVRLHGARRRPLEAVVAAAVGGDALQDQHPLAVMGPLMDG